MGYLHFAYEPHFFDSLAMHANPCPQGPPGTGKTRTILGLLSIVLHAAPAHAAGLGQRKAAAQPMPEYGREDLIRLWAKASPWNAGAADPR